jgi:hypothetical protein
MATIIPATNPLVSPAVGSTTYNAWYMTQLIVKADLTSCSATVHLHMAATTTDPTTNVETVTALMPQGRGAEISFRVDVFQQLSAYPAFGTALEAVQQAVLAYAQANKLV